MFKKLMAKLKTRLDGRIDVSQDETKPLDLGYSLELNCEGEECSTFGTVTEYKNQFLCNNCLSAIERKSRLSKTWEEIENE